MTDVRPVIGITAYEEQARWGPWSEPAVLVPSTYVHAVEAAGGAPMVLPIQSEGVGDLVARVDALVLSGGPDVDPGRYDAAPHEHAQEPRPERDAFELSMIERASAENLPTLAICRGLQVLNVARGGTLHQHLPDVVGHAGHSPHAGEYAWHGVDVEIGSHLARILSDHAAPTASHHHQAIAQLGHGLRISARAEDGTIEAVEDPDLRYLIGVQWHPEVGEDLSLFVALVSAARDRSDTQPAGRHLLH